ncbi:MAG: MinD/ParA family protein [Acidobacteria bacterium]|nr:MinD/ParA family protein [Acidobacteriota bacterium]
MTAPSQGDRGFRVKPFDEPAVEVGRLRGCAAEDLPAQAGSHSVNTLAITSGKGGVGKTNVVVNLGVALARLGQRVAILDADFGLGNVDVLLGLAPPFHLGHLFAGEKTLPEIMIDGPLGVRVIPASSGLRELTALSPRQLGQLSAALDTLQEAVDFLLVDTAAGISDNVIQILGMSQRVLVVTSPEPTAVVDAYAVIKILSTVDPRKELGLIVNGARSQDEADLLFRQLDIAVTRFLHRRVHYLGFVLDDPSVREAVLAQRPVVDHLPQAPASRCFRMLARRVSGRRANDSMALRLVAGAAAPATDHEVLPCA